MTDIDVLEWGTTIGRIATLFLCVMSPAILIYLIARMKTPMTAMSTKEGAQAANEENARFAVLSAADRQIDLLKEIRDLLKEILEKTRR